MAKLSKKKSKRVSCSKRYKIEKKVREHNRKVRKEAKKSGKKKQKDPGVPNSWPYKQEILKEAEERKIRLEEERQKQKERRKKDRQKKMDKKRNLDSLVKDAQRRTQDFERKNAFVAEKTKEFSGGKGVENSLKAYYKEFKKVIDAADVVLQVLDARDPLGSRCPQVEEAVLSAGKDKRLVLLLNKIDLVPKENVEQWLKYLRNEFPTLAFKASTQSQSDHLSHSKVSITHASDDLRKTSRCLGADLLMKLLNNYCRNKDIKTSISVGVVGFPNTGKSSIINSLKRCKACNVGATPGVTTAVQAVQLDKHIKLLDSPGIVMATGMGDSAVLSNCVKLETIQDPVPPVEVILKRCNKQQMMMQYSVEDFSDTREFLSLLAKRLGRLRKGGVPDVTAAGRTVLRDWNTGKIRYYTHPPESSEPHVSAEIIGQMSKEFDIEALLAEEENTLKGLRTRSTSDMVVESEGPMAGMVLEGQGESQMEDSEEEEEEEDEEEEDEEEDEENWEDEKMEEEAEDTTTKTKKVTVVSPAASSRLGSKKNLKSLKATKVKAKGNPEMTLKGNQQVGKAKKEEMKKGKKQRKRADKLAGNLSNALEGALAGLGASATGDSYDFASDFK